MTDERIEEIERKLYWANEFDADEVEELVAEVRRLRQELWELKTDQRELDDYLEWRRQLGIA